MPGDFFDIVQFPTIGPILTHIDIDLRRLDINGVSIDQSVDTAGSCEHVQGVNDGSTTIGCPLPIWQLNWQPGL